MGYVCGRDVSLCRTRTRAHLSVRSEIRQPDRVPLSDAVSLPFTAFTLSQCLCTLPFCLEPTPLAPS
jgi:hypothetical protein